MLSTHFAFLLMDPNLGKAEVVRGAENEVIKLERRGVIRRGLVEL